MKRMCDRCNNPMTSSSMSRLNFDWLCNECSSEEKEHPLYEWGKYLEHLQVVAGNKTDDEIEKKKHFNYGLFADKKWQQVIAETPSILYNLQRVMRNNQNQILKVNGDVEKAINLFQFIHNGQIVLNPFKDETRNNPVHPLEYYGLEQMEALANEYTNSFVSMFDDTL